jgi:hypothetical protein
VSCGADQGRRSSSTEDACVRLRTKLESAFGVEGATLLMDRPPGGWSDLVTNQMLDAKLTALEHTLRAEMASLRGDLGAILERELRAQTWRLCGALFVAFGVFATIVRVV